MTLANLRDYITQKLATVLEELPPEGLIIQHYDVLVPRDALT